MEDLVSPTKKMKKKKKELDNLSKRFWSTRMMILPANEQGSETANDPLPALTKMLYIQNHLHASFKTVFGPTRKGSFHSAHLLAREALLLTNKTTL